MPCCLPSDDREWRSCSWPPPPPHPPPAHTHKKQQTKDSDEVLRTSIFFANLRIHDAQINAGALRRPAAPHDRRRQHAIILPAKSTGTCKKKKTHVKNQRVYHMWLCQRSGERRYGRHDDDGLDNSFKRCSKEKDWRRKTKRRNIKSPVQPNILTVQHFFFSSFFLVSLAIINAVGYRCATCASVPLTPTFLLCC